MANISKRCGIHTVMVLLFLLQTVNRISGVEAAEYDAKGTMNRPKERYRETEKIVSWVGDVGAAVRDKRDKIVRNQVSEEMLDRLKKPPSTVNELVAEPLVLYRAVVSWLSDDETSFSDHEKATKRIGVFCPELLLYRVYLIGEGGGDRTTRRIEAWNEYGRLVPISWYGQDRDDRLSPAGKIDPPPPSVPILSDIGTRLAAIGNLYKKMGLERDAVNSYLEAIHSSPFAENGEKRGSIWLQIAELETRQNEKTLALRAYLKAAYSHKKYAERVTKDITRMINALKDEAETTTSLTIRKVPAVKPALSKNVVLRIASLYREMNLHPLALSLIARTERETSAVSSKVV